MSLDGDQTQTGSSRRVKRISARELTPEEAESVREGKAEPLAEGSGLLAEYHAPLAPGGWAGADSERSAPVVDPTEFSERRRKRSHERLYRTAQLVTLLAFLSAGAGLALGMFESDDFDHSLARTLSGVGVMLAGLGVVLSRRTRLSLRVHGYAVAALFLSAIVLAANVIGIGIGEDGPADRSPPAKRHHR